MKTRILNIFIFIFSISAVSFSQTSESNISSAEVKDSVVNITGNWQGSVILNPVSFGTETSGFYYYNDFPWIETYGVSLSFYAGHTFSFDKLNRSLAKNSPLNHTYNETPGDYKYSNTFIFFAPGLSLYSKNGKYSLDLYKKPETLIYDYGKQKIEPLKVNFHF